MRVTNNTDSGIFLLILFIVSTTETTRSTLPVSNSHYLHSQKHIKDCRTDKLARVYIYIYIYDRIKYFASS